MTIMVPTRNHGMSNDPGTVDTFLVIKNFKYWCKYIYISALYVATFYRIPSNLVETLLTCKNLEQVCWPTPKCWFLRPLSRRNFWKKSHSNHWFSISFGAIYKGICVSAGGCMLTYVVDFTSALLDKNVTTNIFSKIRLCVQLIG